MILFRICLKNVFIIYFIFINIKLNKVNCEKMNQFNNVKFYLFERFFTNGCQPLKNYTLIFNDVASLIKTPFDPTLKTKIIVHGFQNDCTSDFSISVVNDNDFDYNIICVDWSPLAGLSYPEAKELTWVAGISLATMIDWLIYETGISTDQIHIIGHSLGAHVSGIAGSNVNFGTIARITGLDPAAFGINFDPITTLDLSDATFVDAIFTSFLSLGHPLVDVNYFVNGAIEQPDCVNRNESFEINQKTSFYGGSFICSHSMAYEIFVQNLKRTQKYLLKYCRSVSEAMKGDCQIIQGNTEDDTFLSDTM